MTNTFLRVLCSPFFDPANSFTGIEDSYLRRDRPARDAVAGIARWISLHVVGLGVDHDGRPSIGKQRVLLAARAQHHVSILHSRLRRAILLDGEIRHVPGMMALRVLKTMLLARGIEVRPSRFEVGRIALGILMEMHCVLAWWQVLERELYFDACSLGNDGCSPDIITLRVFEFDDLLLDSFRLGESGAHAESERCRNGESTNYQFAHHNVRVVSRKWRFVRSLVVREKVVAKPPDIHRRVVPEIEASSNSM